jgi:peptidoglycan/LPS O-acetylase OafA/YrhL
MLFFVLSGFVLALPYTGVTPRKIDSVPFWIRRIMRLYPAYWTALILALTLRFLVFQPLGLRTLGQFANSHWTLPIGWLALVKHASMISPYLDVNQIDPVIWSLVIEMKISLIFPILLLILKKTTTATYAVSATLSAVMVTALLYSFTGGQSAWVRAVIMVPVFLLGAYLDKYRVRIVTWLRLSIWIRLSVTIVGIFLYDLIWIYPTLNRGVLRFCSACGAGIFIMLFLASRRLEYLGKSKPAQFLGKVSYSFYLVHLPMLIALASVLYPITRSLTLVFAVSLTCSLLTAWGIYVLVETPGQAWGKRMAGVAGKLGSAKPTATFAG